MQSVPGALSAPIPLVVRFRILLLALRLLRRLLRLLVPARLKQGCAALSSGILRPHHLPSRNSRGASGPAESRRTRGGEPAPHGGAAGPTGGERAGRLLLPPSPRVSAQRIQFRGWSWRQERPKGARLAQAHPIPSAVPGAADHRDYFVGAEMQRVNIRCGFGPPRVRLTEAFGLPYIL